MVPTVWPSPLPTVFAVPASVRWLWSGCAGARGSEALEDMDVFDFALYFTTLALQWSPGLKFCLVFVNITWKYVEKSIEDLQGYKEH